MPKDKERSINPAQAQRKLDKAKALKKGKAELQGRRNEKLARRNPDRIQRQIDDLKALESSGEIKQREKQILADLERDVKAIRKAREVLGDKAPQFGNRDRNERRGEHGGGSNGNILGKRRHDGERKPREQPGSSSGSDTDESVRRIPMPRDTPPPIPYQHQHRQKPNPRNANFEPLGDGPGGGERPYQTLPPRPSVVVEVAQTTYSSAPQLRDLKKEAVGRFVPNVVRRKQDAVRGTGIPGQLVEPEELDRLEAQGYVAAGAGGVLPRRNAEPVAAEMRGGAVHDGDGDNAGGAGEGEELEELQRLADEEDRFQREQQALQDRDKSNHQDTAMQPKPHAHHHVEIEEVDDEDL